MVTVEASSARGENDGAPADSAALLDLAERAGFPVLHVSDGTIVAPGNRHTYETLARVETPNYIGLVVEALTTLSDSTPEVVNTANGQPAGSPAIVDASYRIAAPDYRELAEGSGLSRETLTVSGIRSLKSEEVRKKTGITRAGAGVLIPYPALDDDLRPVLHKEADYWRIRLRSPIRLDPTDDRGAKYLGPKGQPPKLYVPPVAPFTDGYLAVADELWITEGEKKCLCATQHGLPTIGVAGVWAWKSRGEGDVDTLIPELRRIVWDTRNVVLAYDSDIAAGHPAWPAFLRLGRVLYELGAGVVHILTLPGDSDA